MQASVHILPVVQRLADVRQVLHHDNGVLELTSVLHGLTRCLLDDVRESILVVRESLLDTPLGGVSLLESLECREHLLADSFGLLPVDEKWFRGSVVLEGTARDQHRLANIESNPSLVLGKFGGVLDFVFNSDVERPRIPVFLQSKFAHLGTRLVIEKVAPQFFLLGVQSKWNPEVGSATGLRNVPTDFVLTRGVTVELSGSVHEAGGRRPIRLRCTCCGVSGRRI